MKFRGSMAEKLTELTGTSPRTFLDFPHADNLDDLDADIAILGIPFGLPYSAATMANDQSRAPDAGNITMIHAERLICNFIGASIRAGHCG